jgi:hypothetical protein
VARGKGKDGHDSLAMGAFLDATSKDLQAEIREVKHGKQANCEADRRFVYALVGVAEGAGDVAALDKVFKELDPTSTGLTAQAKLHHCEMAMVKLRSVVALLQTGTVEELLREQPSEDVFVEDEGDEEQSSEPVLLDKDLSGLD